MLEREIWAVGICAILAQICMLLLMKGQNHVFLPFSTAGNRLICTPIELKLAASFFSALFTLLVKFQPSTHALACCMGGAKLGFLGFLSFGPFQGQISQASA